MDVRTESGLGDGDRNETVDIIPLSLKVFMRLNMDIYVKIPCGAAVWPEIALTGYIDSFS